MTGKIVWKGKDYNTSIILVRDVERGGYAKMKTLALNREAWSAVSN